MGENFENNINYETYWHTSAHILAQAVKRLYPKVKLAIGPATKRGFYYDFDIDPFDDNDLKNIEIEMKKIIKESLDIVKKEVSKRQAEEFFSKNNEEYKLLLLKKIPKDENITFYVQGEFSDLCSGPHLKNTNEIKAFKLLNATGAYFMGNENNKMLCRVYGISYENKEKLDEFLEKLNDAKLRDHNKIARELELFTTCPEIGKGLPIFLPNGAKILKILENFIEEEEEKRGYLFTRTPLMTKNDLFKTSGHWEHYKENMFMVDGEEFVLRPMTCPFQFQVYLNKLRSYRDLPMKLSEYSTCFRKEHSGEMHGLIRLRQFTMSDAHIICTKDQLEKEFSECLELANYCLTKLKLKEQIKYRFSMRSTEKTEKYMGSIEDWNYAEKNMETILKSLNIDYIKAVGEAAFYGPKLDIQIENVYGKEDTLITIQIDFQLAKKFNMEYTNSDGIKETPYIIHRTSIGCYERTLALIIEKFNGWFPLWLSPIQAVILPVSEKNSAYSKKILNIIKKTCKRIKYDDLNEKISYKIRKYQLKKVPIIIVIGDKEEETNTIAVRRKNENFVLTPEEFINDVKDEIENKI